MIVYLLLNTTNDKGYVGQHVGNSVSTRWDEELTGGNRHLTAAVKKYGSDVFSREILNVCSSKEEMTEMEKAWIITLGTYDSKFGYNKTMGGDGGNTYIFLTREQKDEASKKKSASQKSLWEKKTDEEKKEYGRLSSIRLTGMIPTQKMIDGYKKIAETLRGRPSPVKGKPARHRGKTYLEMFGEEKAKQKMEKMLGSRRKTLQSNPYVFTDSHRKSLKEAWQRKRLAIERIGRDGSKLLFCDIAKKMVELYLQGYTVKEISCFFKLDEHMISKRIVETGVQLRGRGIAQQLRRAVSLPSLDYNFYSKI